MPTLRSARFRGLPPRPPNPLNPLRACAPDRKLIHLGGNRGGFLRGPLRGRANQALPGRGPFRCMALPAARVLRPKARGFCLRVCARLRRAPAARWPPHSGVRRLRRRSAPPRPPPGRCAALRRPIPPLVKGRPTGPLFFLVLPSGLRRSLAAPRACRPPGPPPGGCVPCRVLRAASAAVCLGWGFPPRFSAFAPAGARRPPGAPPLRSRRFSLGLGLDQGVRGWGSGRSLAPLRSRPAPAWRLRRAVKKIRN